METTLCTQVGHGVSINEKCTHQGNVAAYSKDHYDTTHNNSIHQRFKNAIMEYHSEQLGLPQAARQINQETALSPKQQTIASNSKLKGHAHHYFLSPYRNAADSHSSTSSKSNVQAVPSNQPKIAPHMVSTSLDLDIPNKDSGSRDRLVVTERLPPITNAATAQKVKAGKTNENKMWLGPPNSIPPNKRNEHIAAYKTISSGIKSDNKRNTKSTPSWTQLQKQQNMKEERQAKSINSDITRELLIEIKNCYSDDYEEDSDSTDSLYNISENRSNKTTHSEKLLQSIHSKSNILSTRSLNSSVHVRSMPDLQCSAKTDYSHYGNYSTRVALASNERSFIDDLSSISSTMTRNKKSVHFAPDVRDISRESRPLPGDKTQQSSATLRLPLTFKSSNEALNQLPAVVEKFMLRNWPILPHITSNPSEAMSVNANVIYIKDGAEVRSNKPMLNKQYKAHKNSATNREIKKTFLTPHSQEHSIKTKNEVKVTLPSTTEVKEEKSLQSSTSNTHTSHVNVNKSISPAKKSTPNNKKQTQPKPKIAKSKPSCSNSSNGSSKKSKKIQNGSETSSRNSTNSASPVLDPDDPDSRYKAYSQAMLAVQARMREFDIKFGSPQKINVHTEKEQGELFGKVVLPSAEIVTKTIKGNKS